LPKVIILHLLNGHAPHTYDNIILACLQSVYSLCADSRTAKQCT